MLVRAQLVVLFALHLIVFAMCAVGLVDAARHAPAAYASAGKQTKGFWLALLAGATAVAFVGLPWPVGIGELRFLAVVAAVVAGVYLADVRPAVRRYTSGGGAGRRRGGW